MTESFGSITDDEIQAYVDDALPAKARAMVAHRLQNDARAQARAQHYRFQRDALAGLYDGMLSEPVPDHLKQAVRTAPQTLLQAISDRDHAPYSNTDEPDAVGLDQKHASGMSAGRARLWLSERPLKRAVGGIAAVLVIGLSGAATGWYAHEHVTRSTMAEAQINSFLEQAYSAHGLYAPQADTDPMEEDRLSEIRNRISDRLGVTVDPLHKDDSVKLVDATLIPVGSGAGAVFTYRDADDRRLSLYVQTSWDDSLQARDALRRDDIAFEYAVDGPLAYALAAPFDLDGLPGLEEWVSRQE